MRRQQRNGDGVQEGADWKGVDRVTRRVGAGRSGRDERPSGENDESEPHSKREEGGLERRAVVQDEAGRDQETPNATRPHGMAKGVRKLREARQDEERSGQGDVDLRFCGRAHAPEEAEV